MPNPPITRKPITDRFASKVAIVTGGSNGIGRSIAEELCKEGCAVTITDISEAGEQTSAEMQANGWQVLFCRGDMADEEFCQSVVERTVERWGKIDYLVNDAFFFTAKGWAHNRPVPLQEVTRTSVDSHEQAAVALWERLPACRSASGTACNARSRQSTFYILRRS